MKFLKKLLLILFVVLIILLSIAALIGYSRYAKALKEKPLSAQIWALDSCANICLFASIAPKLKQASATKFLCPPAIECVRGNTIRF